MIACCALSVSALADDDSLPVQDLFFGEALFYADQGRYFDALERLDTELAQHYGVDEPDLDTLHFHVNDAEFSVGDFELNYRMHHRAGRAITAVLEGDVEELVRNEAAYRLARIHFQKGQLVEAINALDRIDGDVPEGLGTAIDFLRANALMASGSPGTAAEILGGLQEVDGLIGFAGYNMGIALLEDGRRQQALERAVTSPKKSGLSAGSRATGPRRASQFSRCGNALDPGQGESGPRVFAHGG